MDISSYHFELLRQDCDISYFRAICLQSKEQNIIVAKANSIDLEQTTALRLHNEFVLKDKISPLWGIKPSQLVIVDGLTTLIYKNYTAVPSSWRINGQLELKQFFPIALKLVATLKHFHHSGLIHKDIKPSNFLIDDDGCIYLSNFGFAQKIEDIQNSDPMPFFKSTLAYISPEHSEFSEHQIDHRSDLYSIGIILYELLSGCLPIGLPDSASIHEWLHCQRVSEPKPPHVINFNIPIWLSKLVLKLLEKSPEKRYQSADLLESDLLFCSKNWHEVGNIPSFPLGEHYHSTGLELSDTLHQREQELAAMHAALEHSRLEQTPTLVFVQGHAGIGKSKLLERFMSDIAFNGSCIAYSQAERYKQAPYSVLISAFRYALAQILQGNQEDREFWQQHIKSSHHLITDEARKLFPELKKLIENVGHHTPENAPISLNIPNQIEASMRSIIGIFSTTTRPFVLILDDIHWLDHISISLINTLLGQQFSLPFLLVATQRHTNKIPLNTIQHDGQTTILHLKPLDVSSIRKILVSAFKTNQTNIIQLAELILLKTNGCPFFVKSLINTLFNQELIRFDPINSVWICQHDAIQSFSYTDNVALDITQQFKTLPKKTQQLLINMSIVGRSIETALIEALFVSNYEELESNILPAVNIGILHKTKNGFAFFHDLVHTTIKNLANPSEKMQLHLQIGRRLIEQATSTKDLDAQFHGIEHISHAEILLTDINERLYLIPLALEVARNAKNSHSLKLARSILVFTYQLLPLNTEKHKRLQADIMFEQADCELLSGNFDHAQRLLLGIIDAKTESIQKTEAYRLNVELLLRQSNYIAAVNTAIEGLKAANIHISPNPTNIECDMAYNHLMLRLGTTPSNTLTNLTQLDNKEVEALLSLLSALSAPASFTSTNLHFMQLTLMLEITLDHGISGASAAALGWYGVLIAERYEQYKMGFKFCQLARILVLKHHFHDYEGKVLLTLDQVSVWIKPLPYSIECVNSGFSAAIGHGDVATACFECCHQVANLFTLGTPLNKVLQEIERGLKFSQKSGFEDVKVIMLVQRAFIENLHHNTNDSLSGHDFFAAVGYSTDGNIADRMSTLIFWFWLYKGITHYLADEIKDASVSLITAGYYAWSAPAHIHLLDYHFFSALTITATTYCEQEKEIARKQLMVHYHKITTWVKNNPQNFTDKALILEGEIAKFDNNPFLAMSKFEEAISIYPDQDFIQYRAIAHELAGKIALQHGQVTAATAHIERAIQCFGSWGAQSKVQQLCSSYSLLNIVNIHNEQGVLLPSLNTSARYQSAALKATRSMTEFGDDEEILQQLLTIIVEQATARKGVLISICGQRLIMETLVNTTSQGLSVVTIGAVVSPFDIPKSLISSCIRTKKMIYVEQILESPYELDSYWQGNYERSILCLPLIAHNKQLGVLYLEFRPQDINMNEDYTKALKFLAAKAALSLDTAQLRKNFSESVSKHSEIERENLVTRTSLNLGEKICKTGSWHWNLASNIVTCSVEMCRIFGIDSKNNQRTFQSIAAFFHPEDHQSVMEKITKAVTDQKTFDVDHRIILRDGSSLYLNGQGCPVIGKDSVVDYVGTVSDITSRRAAEDALRIAQEDLARVSRINTVGQLTSSIAHEINQPLMSIVSNAAAGLRWLKREKPNLDEAMISMQAIANEGQRAGQIVENIRNLTRNVKPSFTRVNLYNIVEHVLTIVRSEAVHKNVTIKLHIKAHKLDIQGDSIQLQQVMLNILMNGIEAMSEVYDRRRLLNVYISNPDDTNIVIEFNDTGPGIDKEVSQHLFDAFYTTKKNGMGMGLAICQSIIKIHQGKISATSSNKVGSTFSITLPLIKD
nr:AAA family ATPase [Shewanella ulleungensis]